MLFDLRWRGVEAHREKQGNERRLHAAGPALLDFKSVKIAPMRGLMGSPTAMARICTTPSEATGDPPRVTRRR